MKVKIIFLVVVGIVFLGELLLTGESLADDSLIQKLPSGDIDWSEGVVRAGGTGMPSPHTETPSPEAAAKNLNAALNMAYANLLATVNAIRIDADASVADRMYSDAAFREGVTTLARNAPISHREDLPDGTLEIELTMKLTGGFGQFVLPGEIRQVETVTTVTGVTPEKEGIANPAAPEKDTPYSGLIINAAGIRAKPALVPIIVDESGEIVYGPAFVSREFVVSRGMSGFATTLEGARTDRRVGKHPMVVKAIRSRSSETTDIVIANADAARLRSSVAHLDFLKACRVCIVMDPETNLPQEN
ncbi:MAG: hypothetical protein CSA23_06815 [Deltaproteobacteria bacterium]|nr:MAG: hypothetical protein CSA23_06815 [Deltaproteobacteria bacterium]